MVDVPLNNKKEKQLITVQHGQKEKTKTKTPTVDLRLGLVSFMAVDKISLSRNGKKPILECHISKASSPAFRK